MNTPTDGLLSAADLALLLDLDPADVRAMAAVDQRPESNGVSVARLPQDWVRRGKANVARVSEQYGATGLGEILDALRAEREAL